MFQRFIVAFSSLFAFGPGVSHAMAHPNSEVFKKAVAKNGLFAAPKRVAATTKAGDDILKTLSSYAEAGRLNGQVFGLNERGEVVVLGSREELEELKNRILRLEIELARAHDLTPTTQL